MFFVCVLIVKTPLDLFSLQNVPMINDSFRRITLFLPNFPDCLVFPTSPESLLGVKRIVNYSVSACKGF